jgi:two-component system NtrC family sensor kinase
VSDPSAELHQMAALGRLTIGFAHEINSPIGSILSNTAVLDQALENLHRLLAAPDSTEQTYRIVESCRRLVGVDRIACERIRELIRHIKSFARLDPGEPSAVDVNKELSETVKLATCELGRRIELQLDLGPIPEVTGYPQMLNQVFLNLLVNSAQAIRGEGRITVRTRSDGSAVEVSVADNGAGMTEEQKAHLFQPGFTTKPRGEGTGLGLSMSREIVQDRHGGSIYFESELGVGTTAYIRLPLKRSSARMRDAQ